MTRSLFLVLFTGMVFLACDSTMQPIFPKRIEYSPWEVLWLPGDSVILALVRKVEDNHASFSIGEYTLSTNTAVEYPINTDHFSQDLFLPLEGGRLVLLDFFGFNCIELKTGRYIQPSFPGGVLAKSFDRDRFILLSSTGGSTSHVVVDFTRDTITTAHVISIGGHIISDVHKPAFLSKGRVALTAHDRKSFSIFILDSSMQAVHSTPYPGTGPFNDDYFLGAEHSDAFLLISDGHIYTIDANTAVVTLLTSDEVRSPIVFSNDGQYVVYNSTSGMVTHEIKTGRRMPLSYSPIARYALSSDGKKLVVANQDSSLKNLFSVVAFP